MGKNYLAVLLALAVTVSMTACGQATAPETSASASPSTEVSVAQPAAPVTIPISYTDDYLLFEGDELGFTTVNDHTRKLGLMIKDGKAILPAAYTGVSVSEDGIIFTCEISDPNKPSIYKIFDLAGNQIGREYSFISCASPDSSGIMVYREASHIGMRAVAPYAAHIEDASGKRSYWLLDEQGQPYEEQPYTDMEIYEDNVAMARDGYIYQRAADGVITKIGHEVDGSYFEGKYLTKTYYPTTHSVVYSLWDKAGNMIAPPEHSYIDVPFPDRYILYKGWHQSITDEQGFLYDDTGKLLASNSNAYRFTTEEDGRYVGLSYVANTLNEIGNMPILDANGKPEPQGIYFVDKDGKRLTEGYKTVELVRNDGLPYYICTTQQDKDVRLAYNDMLLKQ